MSVSKPSSKRSGVSVRLEGLNRQWQGHGGVHDVSLDIPAGSFVTLLGPSGCGKSTTLRLVAGLESPDEGRVIIGGQDMNGVSPDKRHLSMVFQSYALFPHLSVAENILFGLKVRRVSRAERHDRLARALAVTGLEGLENRRPGALSGGQRQRVALARAVVADHPLCLMDEPLSNLDAKLRQSVRRDIRALQRRLGMTVIYVTHDQTEAMSMADVVVLMRDGRIEQAGPPVALYDHPATAFAASFIGTPPMALVPAPLLVPAASPSHMAGLRAEHVTLTPPDHGTDRCKVRATVCDVEYLGGESFATVRLNDQPEGILTARIPGGWQTAVESEVGLTWPDHALHLFDRETGHRLPCPADHTRAIQPLSAGAMTPGGV